MAYPGDTSRFGDAELADRDPVNLGPTVNTGFNDYGPALTPGGATLYFSSNRPRPDAPPDPGADAWPATVREDLYRSDYDLYLAPVTDRGFGVPQPLVVLNSTFNDGAPAVSPVGDFVYFASDRPGGAGGFDLYRSRRLRGAHRPPSNLGPSVNSDANELDPGGGARRLRPALQLGPRGGRGPGRAARLRPVPHDVARGVHGNRDRPVADCRGDVRPAAPRAHPRRADDARVRHLLAHPPRWDDGANTYAWYYATLALFQHQGLAWSRWNDAVRDELVAHQAVTGPAAGSWQPVDQWSRTGGRVYQTAICTLTPQVYYRYLPGYLAEATERPSDEATEGPPSDRR